MKVFLQTYGCRANQYDTEAVRGMLVASAAEIVDDVSNADVAVFNSCTVTSAAEADLRADVRRASRRNPELISIVMGCAPGVLERDERVAPLRSLPTVGHVVAGGDITAVGIAIGLNPVRSPRPSVQSGSRALLRIQDGCDEHCTFCSTTISRGQNRSRRPAEIVEEAQRLSGTHPEIVLTGIHIGTYGVEIGTTLGALVELLVRETDAVRFRLTSIEATEVDDTLALMLTGDSRRVAPHLHAPLQSGSDRILKLMGRHWYTAAAYEQRVLELVAQSPRFALAADVITGFPGEADVDHALTTDLVHRLPFTSLHVFPYSPRPGTAALRLRERVEAGTASQRAAEIRSVATAKAAAYAQSRAGGTADIVMIDRGSGLTEDYLSVEIPDRLIARRARFDATLSLHGNTITATPDKSLRHD